MTDIEIGSMVVAPVSDSEGEMSYITGKLVSMNKRYATIQPSEGDAFKVGKTKIEAIEEPKELPKRKKEPKDGESASSKRIADGYDYTRVKAASGRISCDNGDSVASRLRGAELSAAYKILAEEISLRNENVTVEDTVKYLLDKYSHLNPGQQRMCLGNRLRGMERARLKQEADAK